MDEYEQGYEDGYDGKPQRQRMVSYLQGYQDGKATIQAIIHEFNCNEDAKAGL